MPEGAEVRTNADQLRPLIKGKQVQISTISGKIARQGLPGSDLFKGPQKVLDVSCKGKLIYIDFEDGHRLTSTLGMSGWWYPPSKTQDVAYIPSKGLVSTDEHASALKHTRVILHNDKPLAMYTDSRNFGNMRIWAPSEVDVPVANIGVDLLQTSQHLHDKRWIEHARLVVSKVDTAAAKYHRMSLADLLLCQELIAGLGNIYRAETLYLSSLSPDSTWGELVEDQKLKLVRNACVVLNIAYFSKGIMFYPVELLKSNGIIVNTNKDYITGHLVYGKAMTPAGDVVLSKPSKSGRTIWYAIKS